MYLDSQACNGLRLWLNHFPYITLACPTLYARQAPPQTGPMSAINGIERVIFVALPIAYTPARFLVRLPQVIRKLQREIHGANYLHFAIGGLWGDWGSVASLVASRAGLP